MLKQKTNILLILIILFAALLRLYGLNWDQNQHLHPDERFLTMVANDIKWPNSISEYLGKNNPLSPYSSGYDFFVYGTFPVYLVKFFSGFITFDSYDYNNITLVGRLMSALMDIGVTVLVYKITKLIFNNKTAVMAAFLYSIFVLPIQLSHFFTTDTFQVFFVVLSFYLALKAVEDHKSYLYFALSGIVFGLALASKISALYALPLILSVIIYLLFKKRFRQSLLKSVNFILLSFLVWRIFDPKTFTPDSLYLPNPKFLANIEQLQSFNDPSGWFPPAVQWIKTTPILFPLKNMIFWGLGIPLGLLLFFSLLYLAGKIGKYFYMLVKKKGLLKLYTVNKENYFLLMIIIWVIAFFIYQGTQFVKAMRYFYILYPFFALLIASTLINTLKNYKSVRPGTITVIMVISLVYPISFMTIYRNEHTRIQASEWIYNNLPAGSTISCEHWDDCLPLPIDNRNSTIYQTEMLEFFNPDSPEKWTKINNQLDQVDYLIMSSNRLWGSIPSVPGRYPQTSKYYQKLLSGNSQFRKIAEFTSRPAIPLTDIELIDDYADESFTVYDHPRVMIFQKKDST